MAGLRSILLGLLLMAACLAPLGAASAEPGIPIRRLEVDPAALTPELRNQQALTLLPRRQFEDLLRRADQLHLAQRQPPQLLEATYQARLDGDALVGSAQWTLHNPGPAAQVYRLQPWNLALRGRPTLDGQPAILGELDAQGAGVLLPASSRARLKLDWSARAEERPEGWWYFLQTPATPLAVLDLDVPVDRQVDCPGHRPVPLPNAEDEAGRQRWRITFGSSKPADLEILVRPLRPEGRPGLLWSAVATTCTLTPGICELRFVIDLRAAHQRLTELSIDLLGPLEVTEIHRISPASGPVNWSPQKRTAGSAVLLKFAEPVERQATLEIRCRADGLLRAPQTERLTVPGVRIAQALSEGESIRVRTAQGMRLSDWDLGDYRLDQALATERDGGETFETFLLRQTGPSGVPPRRPSARLQAAPQELLVQQDAWWQLEPRGASLIVTSTWQVRQGRHFRLPLAVPAGWSVEEAEVLGVPSGVVWRTEKGGILAADFREPLAQRGTVTTRVRLRAPAGPLVGSQPIPSMMPVGGRILESKLAISLPTLPADPAVRLWAGELRDLAGQQIPIPGGPDYPWSSAARPPDLCYQQRGGLVRGVFELTPAPAQAQVEAETSIHAGIAAVTAKQRFRITPLQGLADQVFIEFNQSLPELRWVDSQTTPFRAAFEPASADHPAGGWRLSFATPLHAATEVEALQEIALEPGTDRPIGLPRGIGHLVRVQEHCPKELFLESEGLDPVAAPLGCARAWRQREASPCLILRTTDPAANRPAAEPVLGDAELVLWLRGATEHYRYRGLVQAEQAAGVRLDLPPDATLELLSVNGVARADASGSALPVALKPGINRVDLTYQRPSSRQHIGFVLRPQAPHWQGLIEAVPSRVQLVLPPDLRLLMQSRRYREQVLPRPRLPRWLGVSKETLAPLQFASGLPTTESAPAALNEDQQPTYSVTPDEAERGLVCVESWVVPFAGAFLAVGVCLAGLRQKRGRLFFAAAMLLVGSLLLLWLPPGLTVLAWWLLAAASLLGLSCLVPAAPPVRARSSVRAAGVALGLCLLFACGAIVQAQAPAEDIVYVLRDPQRLPEDAEVLVPKALLTRLEALANQPGVGLPKYSLLEAAYDASFQDSTMRLLATYQVELFADEPVAVELPLEQVRLVQALVDSAPALANPLEQRGGLKLWLQGKGTHAISLTLDAPLTTLPDGLELRMRIPPVTASRLRCRLPLSCREPRLVGPRGRQSVSQNAQAFELQAELGRAPELRVQWQTGTAPEPTIQVREAILIEGTTEALTLRAGVRVEVARGAASQFRFALPPALDVQLVELHPEPGESAPPRLRDWRVESQQEMRTLVIDLARPSSGRFTLLMEFAVRLAAASSTAPLVKLSVAPGGALSLVPVGLALADLEWRLRSQQTIRLGLPELLGAAKRETLVGVRTDGLRLEPIVPSRGLTVLPDPAAFQRAWPAELGRADNLLRVFSGRHPPAPRLQLRLAPERPSLEVTQRLQLQADRGGAELRARLDLAMEQSAGGLLRVDLPAALDLAEVQGPDLLRWDQQGRLLQVWLKSLSVERSTLTLSGWLPAQADATGVELMALPRLSCHGARAAGTRIEVLPRTGVTVEPERLQGLTLIAGEGLLTLEATRPEYTGTLLIKASPAELPASGDAEKKLDPAARLKPAPAGCRILGVWRQTLLAPDRDTTDATTCLLSHSPSAALAFHLPPDRQIRSLTCAGVPLAEWRVSADRLLVVLPPRSGCEALSIVTTGPQSIQTTGQAALDAVMPVSAEAYPVTWEVVLPGVSSVTSNQLSSSGSAKAACALHRLETLLKAVDAARLPVESSSQSPTAELLSWERAYRRCRAQVGADLSAIEADPVLTARLANLDRESQRLLPSKAADGPTSSSDQDDCLAIVPAGAVVVRGSFGREPAELVVGLRSPAQERWQRSLLLSVFVLGAAALLLLCQRLDPRLSWLARGWPELLALAGLGLYLVGAAPEGAIVLIALGMGGRLARVCFAILKLEPRELDFAAPRGKLPSTVIRRS